MTKDRNVVDEVNTARKARFLHTQVIMFISTFGGPAQRSLSKTLCYIATYLLLHGGLLEWLRLYKSIENDVNHRTKFAFPNLAIEAPMPVGSVRSVENGQNLEIRAWTLEWWLARLMRHCKQMAAGASPIT